MTTFSTTVPLGANLGLLQKALIAMIPSLKFDGSDGSYINASTGASNIAIQVVVPDGTKCSVSIAGSAASDNDYIRDDSTLVSSGGPTCSSPILAPSIPSGSTHTLKYKTGSGTGHFYQRRIVGASV